MRLFRPRGGGNGPSHGLLDRIIMEWLPNGYRQPHSVEPGFGCAIYSSMFVYLFASETHDTVSAFTSDETGANLPFLHAPWRPLNAGRALPITEAADSVGAAVQQNGFFLLNAKAHADRKPRS